MPQYATEAVVLSSMDFGESDRIVTFYTLSFGKLKGIAKGAKRSKKRFGINLEPFSMVRLHFFEKRDDSLVRVSACDLLSPFQGIREDLFRIAYGSYMIEVVEKMAPEREMHPVLFRLLIDFLGLLEKKGLNEEHLRVFEIRVLADLGLRPHLSSCVVCRKSFGGMAGVLFSPEKGGALCMGCSSGLHPLIPVSLGTLKTLQMALKIEPQKVPRLVFGRDVRYESRELLGSFIRFHTGKELRSLEFIEKIKGVL
jgi:DNA repair protein RecO (recombination protein O)